jgi:ATP-citrate lyase beta-subunit
MAQRGIREYDGKKMLAKYWTDYISKDFKFPGKIVLVDPKTKLDDLPKKHKWLKTEKLVVKPDQLFGKRGKHGLIKANASFTEFVPHKGEFYVAIKSNREGDMIYFSNHGGVDIESVWKTVSEIQIGVDQDINKVNIESKLPKDTPKEHKKMFAEFTKGLYKFYSCQN